MDIKVWRPINDSCQLTLLHYLPNTCVSERASQEPDLYEGKTIKIRVGGDKLCDLNPFYPQEKNVQNKGNKKSNFSLEDLLPQDKVP